MKRENLWKLLFFSLFLAWNAIYLSGIYVCVYWFVCRSLWFESLRFQTRTTFFQKIKRRGKLQFFRRLIAREENLPHHIHLYTVWWWNDMYSTCSVIPLTHTSERISHRRNRIQVILTSWEHGKIDCEHGKMHPTS